VGTGLGLSISYDIVTLQHGGTIAVDCAATVHRIHRTPAEKPAHDDRGESVMSVSILVVDDEADVAKQFSQQFRREVRQGHYVIHFIQSAEEARGKLGNGIWPKPIVVLSDINMHGMDGWCSCARSRSSAPTCR
jgi:PleD family two-component response regulator